MDCQVKNANYRRVMTVLEKFLKEGDRGLTCCPCNRCVNDVAAIALNYLPPHYYVEEQDGELGSPWIMVETAVMDAIDRVKQTPHHGRAAEMEPSKA